MSLYEFVRNQSIAYVDVLGENPFYVAGAAAVAAFGAAWKLGEFFNDVLDAMEEAEESKAADEEHYDAISDLEKDCEASAEKSEKESAEAMDQLKKAGESGAEVGGTAMQGPTELPTRKSETLGTGIQLGNEIIDRTNNK